MGYALHSVIIKKPMDLDKAKSLAQDFIKDKKKNFYTELKTSFRFRYIPKGKFVSKSFKTKVINPEVSLLYGELKPEHSRLEGAGLLDWLKDTGSKIATGIKDTVKSVKTFFSPRTDSLNNTSKKTLEEYGDKPITKLQIYRTPITPVFEKALNALSLGTWNKMKSEAGYDKFFHLALIATVEGSKNIVIEKTEVVNLSTSYNTQQDTEVMDVPITRPITLNEMIAKTQEEMGTEKFYAYDAFQNNCQMFVIAVLKSVGLLDDKINKFVFQDVSELSRKLPSVNKIANVFTDISGWWNKISGKGKRGAKKEGKGKGFENLMSENPDLFKPRPSPSYNRFSQGGAKSNFPSNTGNIRLAVMEKASEGGSKASGFIRALMGNKAGYRREYGKVDIKKIGNERVSRNILKTRNPQRNKFYQIAEEKAPLEDGLVNLRSDATIDVFFQALEKEIQRLIRQAERDGTQVSKKAYKTAITKYNKLRREWRDMPPYDRVAYVETLQGNFEEPEEDEEPEEE